MNNKKKQAMFPIAMQQQPINFVINSSNMKLN